MSSDATTLNAAGEPAATYERDGHVATITYNRPEAMNAVNGAMREALDAAWTQFREDDEAWVGIVTGTGRTFCAGADLRDGKGSVGTWPGSFWEWPTITTFESGMEIWKPTIAAVNGPCIGYGLTAVLACDFVLASERATFAYPEVKIGVSTIVGALRLPKHVAMADALDLLLTGDPIDAEHAKEIGLAWRVHEHDELMAEARRLGDRLCQGAPLAVRATSEMAHRGQDLPWTDAVRMGEAMRRVVGQSEDSIEGGLAWAEKRDPQWKGR
ncbi:MAG: enoyl-CoA hydratase-related protein [Acidimicrobiales bacterium]|jgi:enoyl-CoA hydratase/carnithine racemase|nr:enoyl-CoA hydratase-related protein [Acidimicrobiales bacterium]